MSNSCATKRKIICLETKQIYDSAMAIEKQFGYANANIIACCKDKLHTAYNYTWMYYEDFLSNKNRSVDRRKNLYIALN